MVIPIDIMNQAIHVIIDETRDSPFTIILSVSTLIVAIGTIIGLWKTRESNKLFALEISAKFNPSFDFTKRKLTQVSNSDTIWNFECKMINIGNVSVSNISIYYYTYSKLIPINEVIQNKENIKNNLLKKIESTLEPKRDNIIGFTFKKYPAQDTRFVIWLEFEYLQFKAEGIVFLDHLATKKTGYTWFDNDFIKNKLKELNI